MKNMFWGVVIIVIGLLVVINSVFGINLPIFKILIGCLLVYWGLRIILGGFSFKSNLEIERRATATEAVFSESVFAYTEDTSKSEYVTVFGSSKLDLSGTTEFKTNKLSYVVVFGSSELIVPRDVPMAVKTQSVFASVKLPDGSRSVFGDIRYLNGAAKDTEPKLVIEAQTVFGELVITEK